tara:strand:- start:9681 stop:11651 length:1971 start_codon:yes stop_codon:yes gene_type:complete
MKKIAYILLITFCTSSLFGQDCTQDPKAQQAKNNISKRGSSPVCANAAQFYAYLCACKNKPRTAEQARNLKATLEQIKSSYNSYGSPCEGIGRITDVIPNCMVGDGNGAGINSNTSPFIEADYRQVMDYKNQLDALAQSFSDRLSEIGQLIQTSDPELLLQDFNSKMRDVNYVESDIKDAQVNSVSQGIENIANAAKYNNQTSLYQGIGALASLYDLGEKKREAKAREEELRLQQRSRMSQIYWNAKRKIEQQKKEFENMAAYVGDAKMEAYYLDLIDNLECYEKSMLDNWSINSTHWLTNNCPAPTKPGKAIPNNLVSQEKLASDIAARKYRIYLENRSLSRGIGMDFEYVKEQFGTKVIAKNVDPKGPAYAVGIREGYQINAIDDVLFTKDEVKEVYKNVMPANPDEKTLHWFIYDYKNGAPFLNEASTQIIRDAISRDRDGITIWYFDDKLTMFERIPIATRNEVTGLSELRKGAISYAAKALTLNQSAKNYQALARYYQEENSVIALEYMIQANALGVTDPLLYNALLFDVSSEIQAAVQSSNDKILTPFITSGLDKKVLIAGSDVLSYAIATNNPDATQILLNAYVQSLSDAQRTNFIQKALLVIARENSEKCLSRLLELGINTDFTLEGESPKSVAEKFGSKKIIDLLNN